MGRKKNEYPRVRLTETIDADTMYEWRKFKRSEKGDVALRSLLWNAAQTGYNPFPFSKKKPATTNEEK